MPSSQPLLVIERDAFDDLFSALTRRGYTIVGPTVQQKAIVYDELRSSADLPIGWTDEQDAGSYRLVRRNDDALFGYAVGPHSWKKYQLPPEVRLWRAQLDENGAPTTLVEQAAETPHYAFIGARSCELHAIGIFDRVRVGSAEVDPADRARREDVFVIAVNCAQAGGTCFCVSMNTGPKASFGFDLAITEILEDERHYFVTEVATERGADVMRDVPHTPASTNEVANADSVSECTASQMGREMDTTDIKELLYRNMEHPRWFDVADRCLTCGNCTMVCPTCFCTTVEDVTDLEGKEVERWERWDSCFTIDYSHLHGGSVRQTARSRYRQWMTHKLATWYDQFGSSGCVGCGRCLTWCPVAIDITEEVWAIRETEASDAKD